MVLELLRFLNQEKKIGLQGKLSISFQMYITSITEPISNEYTYAAGSATGLIYPACRGPPRRGPMSGKGLHKQCCNCANNGSVLLVATRANETETGLNHIL